MPQIEVARRDGKFVVRAELPGLKREDIEVEIAGGSLRLSGERQEDREERDGGFFRSERSYGKFSRSIPLPEGVTGDDARAEFKDGVLEVTMSAPHEKKKEHHKIEVA
jgi:HSP20 family protein